MLNHQSKITTFSYRIILNGKFRLVNMDGFKIRDVTELMSRGAYVLIPVGQSFRDTWYFLPDNAIDTRFAYKH